MLHCLWTYCQLQWPWPICTVHKLHYTAPLIRSCTNIWFDAHTPLMSKVSVAVQLNWRSELGSTQQNPVFMFLLNKPLRFLVVALMHSSCLSRHNLDLLWYPSLKRTQISTKLNCMHFIDRAPLNPHIFSFHFLHLFFFLTWVTFLWSQYHWLKGHPNFKILVDCHIFNLWCSSEVEKLTGRCKDPGFGP